jgi:hypothetical protein
MFYIGHGGAIKFKDFGPFAIRFYNEHEDIIIFSGEEDREIDSSYIAWN